MTLLDIYPDLMRDLTAYLEMTEANARYPIPGYSLLTDQLKAAKVIAKCGCGEVDCASVYIALSEDPVARSSRARTTITELEDYGVRIGIEGNGTAYCFEILNQPDLRRHRDELGLANFNDVAV